MRRWHIAGVLLGVTGLLAVTSCAYPPGYGPGGGMGPGMMGGGMMGGGPRGYSPSATLLTMDQAADAVRAYIGAYRGRLVLTEIMDFAWNYYAEIEEEDTGIHAMELLIDKETSRVYPEMGPNMMWNSKYSQMGGMMGGSYYGDGPPTADMPVSPEQAQANAQQYLDANLPGLTVAEADRFYGYYTLHTLRNDRLEGMLSVNGHTGAVWYHSWHGPFLDMKEFE